MTIHWQPEAELLTHLDEAVNHILATQKPNGQFGSEPWISTDQNVLLPLAVAWSREGSAHHHSAAVLDAIVRGGLALEEAQDEQGMWIFRKKDYSEWGPSVCLGHTVAGCGPMPAAAARRWETGLRLGYGGIAQNDMDRLHNIPAHHAMGLYCAGQSV
ncbi:MAG: hypothetical protein GKR89_19190 [Candidatus Latescibacteria bacterium]|nr:hypothetical protein [Candidatus Latescibacterota bacterium]